MHIGRTGQYAICAAVDLAQFGTGTVEVVSARHGIPAAFMQRLVEPMRRAGIIVTKRGPGGGLTLARPSGMITVLDVLRSVGADNGSQDRRWLDVIPAPLRLHLENVVRQLSTELQLLTLADLTPTPLAWTGAGSETDIARLFPPRRLVDFIGRHAASALKADRCSLYFGGFYTNAFDWRSGKNNDRANDFPVRPDQIAWVPMNPIGIVEEALRTGQPALISDIAVDALAGKDVARRFNVRSVSAVPIQMGGDSWGALIVAKQRPHDWLPEEVNEEVELAEVTRLAILGHNRFAAEANALSN